MSKGFFIDRIHKPAEDEIMQVLNKAEPVWKEIINFIEEHYKAKAEYKFYGKNYGWAQRFTKSGKSFIALYSSENEFTVQIILNKLQAAKALGETIKPEIKNIIANTPEIHEGKWIYFKVASKEDIVDVKKLLKIKIENK